MSEDELRRQMAPVLKQARDQGAREVLDAIRTLAPLLGGVGAAPPAERPPRTPLYPAHAARHFSDYVEPDDEGEYAGDLHEQFGLTRKQFADATGLMMRLDDDDAITWVEPQ